MEEEIPLQHIIPYKKTIIHNAMPPPSRMPQKKKVLTEEEYTSTLEAVIEKEYFPHLSKLRNQLQLLEDKNLTFQSLRSVFQKNISMKSALTPNRSLSTVASLNQKLSEEDRNSTIDHEKISLQTFLNNYTSEDNDSFEKLQEEYIKERRKLHHWAYESNDIQNLIQNGQFISEYKRAGMLMLYYIGNKVLSIEERKKMDHFLEEEVQVGDQRPNSVDPWQFRVRNQLMFPPELKDSEDTCKMNEFQLISQDVVRKSVLPIQQSEQFLAIESSQPILTTNTTSQRMTHHNTINKSNHKFIINKNTNFPDALKELIPSIQPLEAPHTPSIYSTQGDYGNDLQAIVPMTPIVNVNDGFSPIYTWGELSGPPIVLDDNEIHPAAQELQNQLSEDWVLKFMNELNALPDPNENENEEEDIEHEPFLFAIKPESRRESIARSLDKNGKRKKIEKNVTNNLVTPNSTKYSSRRSSIEDTPMSSAFSVTSEKNKAGSISSLSSRQSSLKEKYNKLTPAGKALTKRLNKKQIFTF